jgi:hypothetical protein
VLAKPTRVVSEYVKVYSSLWILDITRRGQQVARPHRRGLPALAGRAQAAAAPGPAAAWYIPLSRYAIGRLTYEQILPLADTPGKRAELYFYEAMRRLAEGRSDDAPRPVEQGSRDQDVLVLRVRHGLPLPAQRRPHLATRREHI